MYLSALPTVYDLTPDYAGNLAAEMFWPGDQGRWQAANLADFNLDALKDKRITWGEDLIPTLIGAAHGHKMGGWLGLLVGAFAGYMAPLPAVAFVTFDTARRASGYGFSGYPSRRRRRRYRR